MKKELRNKILEKVGDELNRKGFLLVDSSSKWMIFHRKNYTSETYDILCDLIVKRLPKAYCWLDKKKQNV